MRLGPQHYHPFYITSDRNGGYERKSDTEKGLERLIDRFWRSKFYFQPNYTYTTKFKMLGVLLFLNGKKETQGQIQMKAQIN